MPGSEDFTGARPLVGRRVVIYGPSGSGKTTLSQQIGAALGLKVIELDGLIHSRPNWEDVSLDEFREKVQAELGAAPEGWVTDGNYSPVRDLILPQADTIIWLRLPFPVVYARLWKRTMRRMITRELLWGVNRESFRMGFFSRESILLWGITAWRPHQEKTRKALREMRPEGARLFVLRSPGQVRAFVRRVEREAAAARPEAAVTV